MEMAVITAEQRALEIQAREDFARGLTRYQDEIKDKFIRTLSVADRLMRRIEAKHFETVFVDDLGEFVVETRLMTSSERFHALEINKKIGETGGDLDEYEKLMKQMKQVARDITVTPGMNIYWESDQVSDDVIVALVMRTVYGTLEAVGDSLTSFRGEQSRSVP